MKKLILTVIFGLFYGSSVFAHDEGHGPKLADSGRYGGTVSPIVNLRDASKGTKAELVYKAEMVRSNDGKIRVYLYDSSMNTFDLAGFNKKAKGVLRAEIKGKFKKEEFEVTLEGHSFVGTHPKPPAKPFDLDFHFTQEMNGKARTLLTAFDNQD